MKARRKKTDREPSGIIMRRLFDMILSMNSGAYTFGYFAQNFNVSERTVIRYINILEDLGFEISKEGPYYSITKWPEEFLNIKAIAA